MSRQKKFVCLFVFGATAPPPQWARASSFTRFLDHKKRHTTVARTPLDEWPTRRLDLYLTTHNTHNRQASNPPVGFFCLTKTLLSVLRRVHCFDACSSTVNTCPDVSVTTLCQLYCLIFESSELAFLTIV